MAVRPVRRLGRAGNLNFRISGMVGAVAVRALSFGVVFLSLIFAAAVAPDDTDENFGLREIAVIVGFIALKEVWEWRRNRAARAFYDAHDAMWNDLSSQ